MTVLGNATIGALSKLKKVPEAMERARESLQVVGLADRQNSLAGSLTVSDRKRLEIARALASQPRLLFLDEVMSGLRPTEVSDTIDLIKKIHDFGITIVIIEHIMSAIMRLCDRIIVLHHGQKIGEGSPKEISKHDSVIQAYLGEDYIA
jgi:branched-chain amino acid transport system ATP-binding protein